MAFMTPTSWNVMTTGNDLNGGGFVVGQAGTDYSLNAAANSAGSNISTTDAVANGTTTLTSATGAFTSAIVGNIIYLAGGSGSLAAVRRGVVSLTNATTIVLDAVVAAGTGITMNIGGAYASPGGAAQFHIAGNTINVKTGTYTVTSASTNIAVGCLSLLAGAATNQTKLIGYNVTYGDLVNVNSSANRPLIKASAIATFTLVTSNGGVYAENIAVDGSSLTSSRGFNGSNTLLYRCSATACTNTGFNGTTTTNCVLCEASACLTAGAGFLTTNNDYCYASGNSVSDFSGGACDGCIANGGSSFGFNTTGTSTAWINCIAYGKTGSADGFSMSATGGVTATMINCISNNNAGAGAKGVGTFDGLRGWNNVFYNNAGGTTANLTTAALLGTITLTVDPFVNAAGGNFALNTTAGGGALLRAAGLVGAFPAISTTSKLDVGAAQHADPAAGGLLTHPGMAGGIRA